MTYKDIIADIESFGITFKTFIIMNDYDSHGIREKCTDLEKENIKNLNDKYKVKLIQTNTDYIESSYGDGEGEGGDGYTICGFVDCNVFFKYTFWQDSYEGYDFCDTVICEVNAIQTIIEEKIIPARVSISYEDVKK